ncbi:MAG: DUF4293 domain-containing protein [Flavobacteriaceae bacterium]|nr:DUF4293 domain-containing protein [Flavobacteriaceae bacterium]
MLQRIQTIYLLIATLLAGGIIYVLPLWTNNDGVEIYLKNLIQSEDWKMISMVVAFGLSAILSFIAIFLYKNRKQQIGINRFNIVVNFYLLGIIVYHLLILPGESEILEKGIGLFIPVLMIVFLALANKSILKDEKLVKSVDRLR